ncbi:hypothetical protein D3C76_799350 [compost metagenome]
MPRGNNRERDEVDLDDEDFDIDEEDAIADDEDDDADELEAIVQRHVSKAQVDIDRVLAKFEARLQDHEHRITNVEKIVTNLSGIKSASGKRPAIIQESEATGLDRFLDVTLGTAGRAMHAVVDTIAFVGESAVDIVTLGRARVNRSN